MKRHYSDDEFTENDVRESVSLAVRLLSTLINIAAFMNTDAGRMIWDWIVRAFKFLPKIPGVAAKLPGMIRKLKNHGAPADKVEQAAGQAETLSKEMDRISKLQTSNDAFQKYRKQKEMEARYKALSGKFAGQIEAMRRTRSEMRGISSHDCNNVLRSIEDTNRALSSINVAYQLYRAKARNRY